MSVLEFVSSLAKSTAWPAAALVGLFVLRRPISITIERRLRRAKFGSAEFEFDAEKTEELIASVEGERVELERLKASSTESFAPPAPPRSPEDHSRAVKLAELAEVSPVGAFLTSFIELERTLRMLLSDDADMSRVSPLELGKEALKQGLLSDTEYRAYQYLRDSRNQVVHGSDDRLTPAQAVELATLTESLLETALVRKVVQRQREIETMLSDRPLSQGNSNEE